MAEVSRFIEDSARAAIDLTHRNVVHPHLTRGKAQEDREIAHERALDLAESLQDNPLAMALMSSVFTSRDPILRTRFAGIIAPNPLGLAAGFDKNARIPQLLGEGLGFGIVTVGSITKVPYGGNERPRIFDLPNNNGLINRMGFPGDGADEAEARLKRLPDYRNYVLVVNVAASKPSFENGTQVKDYGSAYSQMLPYGDCIEVNISSPNTPGVRGLQEPEIFAELASHIAELRKYHIGRHKPLIYKFGPDLAPDKLEKDLKIAIDNGADGVTLTNTSTDQELRNSLLPDKYQKEVGGMSGALLNSKALEISHRAYKYVGEELSIIRAGGIKGTGRDLWESLTYGGAVAVEAYTSFVRPNTSTPNYTVYALRDLTKAMRKVGMPSINDFRELRGKKAPYPLT